MVRQKVRIWKIKTLVSGSSHDRDTLLLDDTDNKD